MSCDPDFDVVIVGAGIAGAGLACALRGQGLRLALVEAGPLPAQTPAPVAGLAGYDARVSAITPASQALLDRLGVWSQVEQLRSCAYRRMEVWDAEGTGTICFDAAELDVPLLGTIVENRILRGALLHAVRKATDVRLFNPARVDQLQRNDSGQPRLGLADGSTISARLLVAADGPQSNIRQLAGFRTREWDYGQHALVATVETAAAHQATAYQRFLPSGPLAFLPLSGAADRAYCSIVWSLQSDLSERVSALDDAHFLAQLGAAFEHRLGTVRAASARVAFPLRQRHAIDYVQAGIALIGDAAHTIHPLAGQGINLGLQDVAVLAEELCAAHRRGIKPGDEAVLRRYQRRRKGENLLLMAAMEGFKRLFGDRRLALRWARNVGMNWVGRSGPLKRQLMRQAMGIR